MRVSKYVWSLRSSLTHISICFWFKSNLIQFLNTFDSCCHERKTGIIRPGWFSIWLLRSLLKLLLQGRQKCLKLPKKCLQIQTIWINLNRILDQNSSRMEMLHRHWHRHSYIWQAYHVLKKFLYSRFFK